MDILQQHDIHLLSVEILIRKKRLDFLQKILVMEDSRLVKQVAFSEALDGKKIVEDLSSLGDKHEIRT